MCQFRWGFFVCLDEADEKNRRFFNNRPVILFQLHWNKTRLHSSRLLQIFGRATEMSTEKLVNIPRPEHPRPDFMRDTFYNLNGEWAFAFDDKNEGLACGWFKPDYALPQRITVPFCYQCAASGIGPTDEIHEVIWYQRRFTVPEQMQGRRILLRFGAVDHSCTVYVNGHAVGGHQGGYTPFAMDITDFLADGENDLRVRAVDMPDCTQLRGKQYWQRGLTGCWYTPVSGIWQTVYLEAVSALRVEYIHITPDIDIF